MTNEMPQWPDIIRFPVWVNPTADFREPLRGLLRGLLTREHFYVWRSVEMSHAEFTRACGIDGVHLLLRSGMIHANDETVEHPDAFPWVFPDNREALALDMEQRRHRIADWLRASPRLTAIYPEGFVLHWYQ